MGRGMQVAHIFSSEKANPPLPRNAAPYSGTVAWIRSLRARSLGALLKSAQCLQGRSLHCMPVVLGIGHLSAKQNLPAGLYTLTSHAGANAEPVEKVRSLGEAALATEDGRTALGLYERLMTDLTAHEEAIVKDWHSVMAETSDEKLRQPLLR